MSANEPVDMNILPCAPQSIVRVAGELGSNAVSSIPENPALNTWVSPVGKK